MKAFSLFMVDKELSGIELTPKNIPIFKQGGMITAFKNIHINSISLEDGD